VGQKERDDTRTGAASAKVVPLRPASIRKDLPTGYLEQVARRVRANLTDLVATADTYNLDLATEFRIAADLLQKPSGTSQPLQVAESAGLSLTNGTGGCWGLVDHDGNVLGLIVAIDGRLVLALTSWSRRDVLAAGGAVLLAPFAGLGARADTASGGDTAPLPDLESAERLDYVMQHPRSVDMAAAAHLREQAQSLAKQYDLAASTSLLPAAGECMGQVTFLHKQAPDGPVLRQLQVTEAQLATLMGQLVWDASQRRDHATATGFYDQAISAANRAGETTAEAYARLRKSYVALYGEYKPQTGLRLAQEATTLAATAGSHALQGLALLHVGEGYAMLGDRSHVRPPLVPRRRIFKQCSLLIPPMASSPPTASDGYKAPAISPSATAPRRGRSSRTPRVASTGATSRRRSSSGTWPSCTSASVMSTRQQSCSTGQSTCSRSPAAGAA
jgi:hypothetical protein